MVKKLSTNKIYYMTSRASLILGIISIVTAVIIVYPVLPIFWGLGAVVLGVVSLDSAERKKARLGIKLGAIGMILGTLRVAFGIAFVFLGWFN